MQFAKLQSYCSPQQPNWQCSREPSWRRTPRWTWRSLVPMFDGIPAEHSIEITLIAGGELRPVLSGIEIVEQPQ